VLTRVSDKVNSIVEKQSLLESYTKGLLVLHDAELNIENICAPKTNDILHIDEKEAATVFKRSIYVRNAAKDCGNIPTKVGLKESVFLTAELIQDDSPPSDMSVWRWWKRVFARGDENALIPLKSRKTIGQSFCADAMNILADVLDEYYLTPEKPSKSMAYDFYTEKMEHINRLRHTPLKYPRRAQFYRMLSRQNKYEEMKRREGKKRADMFFRTSKKGPDVYSILERVEVDHTPMDVFVIDEKTNEVLGRPFLTLLLDYYSRMVLGFEIGFEPNSELAVMRALKHAILPKLTLNNDTIDINNDWMAFGVPTGLICDNGLEFHSHHLRRVAHSLGIELQFCPKLRPNYKGAVERFLGTLNREVSHLIPGTTQSNIEERGDYPSIERATVTLYELRALVTKWIVDVYSKRLHSGIHTTPEAKWNEGMKNFIPRLPPSPDVLKQLVLKEKYKTLSHKGIQHEHLFYNSDELLPIRHFLQPKEKVLIRFNPENMGSIWVLPPKETDFVEVPCTFRDYAEGLTLRQHKKVFKEAQSEGNKHVNKSALITAKKAIFEKIKELAKSKKLRDRQRAARDNKDSNGEDVQTYLDTTKRVERKRIETSCTDLSSERQNFETINL